MSVVWKYFIVLYNGTEARFWAHACSIASFRDNNRETNEIDDRVSHLSGCESVMPSIAGASNSKSNIFSYQSAIASFVTIIGKLTKLMTELVIFLAVKV